MLGFGTDTSPLAIGMVELVLLVAVTGVVVGALLTWRRQRWASVHTSWIVPATADRVARSVGPMLDTVPRTTLRVAGGQSWTVSVKRAQGWAVVVALLAALPTGGLSLLLLLVREEATLQVLVRSHPEGAEVEIYGSTATDVAENIARGLARLAGVPVEVSPA